MASNTTATPAEPAPSSNPPPPSSNQPTPTPTPTPAPSPSPPASSPPPASQPVSSNSPPPAPSSNSPAPPPPPPKSSSPPPASTLVVTAPTPAPSVDVRTSLVVISSAGGTVVITVGPSGQVTAPAHPTSTNPTELQNASKNSSSGLSTGGKTAIAVVIPVVVVALLVLGALFFWRKRKQRKNNEDERRKEVEEYGYNPNHDPTLPTVAMAEDESGYRGWGNTQTSSNRKASTTLTSGMTHSDSNSNPGGYAPVSPVQGAFSEANSNDVLMHDRRETLDSDGIGALGAVGGAAPNSTHNASGIRRGPSNASSSYSMGDRSDHSAEFNNLSPINHEYYNDQNNHAYYQPGPYGSADPYAGSNEPVIRDVSARRNTRIEKPTVFPQQGNSGIAQNF